MTAASQILTIGTPATRRGKPTPSVNRSSWDEIRQSVWVYSQSDLDIARVAGDAEINDPHPDYDDFYVDVSRETKLVDWDGWRFDLVYKGAFDLSRRYRVSNTQHDQFSWDTTENEVKTRYEMLLPRMTVVDVYFDDFTPNWSQQGNTITLPNAPTPPSLPPWTTDDVVTHVPYGWVLDSRESEYVGDFPGSLHLVTDTVTYYEQSRPAGF